MRLLRADQEDAEEGYFASISDLMIGILFVFLLMLTVLAINFRQAEHDQMVKLEELQKTQLALKHQTELAKQREAEALRQREEAERQRAKNEQLKTILRQALSQMEREIDLRELARRSLLTTLQEQLRARGIEVVIDQHSGVLRLSGDLLFATGSADLSDGALRTVHSVAEVMALTIPCYAAGTSVDCGPAAAPVLETVLIEGHTDHRPFNGTSHFRDNDQLSTERALAVLRSCAALSPSWIVCATRTGYSYSGLPGMATGVHFRTHRAPLKMTSERIGALIFASSLRPAPRTNCSVCAIRCGRQSKPHERLRV